ncbi:hypothetical protein GCM10009093_21460 [Brevundimonas terrae]|uniref:Uncharacterized protein n=1 Tax=Brevundimonas terrae TaxID=363631 RepID=A0ABN0YGA4_9CAUL|nr:hypothetical protein [Brevundimonas terrae]NIJ26891.1 hypothetical protein [Brevundimonas terrae]
MISVKIGDRNISHTGPAPYLARSASDKNPDWPFWFVADAVGFNGISIEGSLGKLFDKQTAIFIAAVLNDAAGIVTTNGAA